MKKIKNSPLYKNAITNPKIQKVTIPKTVKVEKGAISGEAMQQIV